ncbi:MAG: hypothetical protein M3Y87_01650 [Myxococcota bacterium]|nr:hypothetical protein [Myxococcota bacterium]
MRVTVLLASLLIAIGCGDPESGPADAGAIADAATADAAPVDAGALDAGELDAAATDGGDRDGGMPDDGGSFDAGADAGSFDAGADASTASDAGVARTVILPGFCPATATVPGLYRGTLASNLNDFDGISGCAGVSSAPGRDGALRVELAAGQTLSATYRHAGDGILYLLDRCPVPSTCLAGSDASLSGAESVTWTNDDATTNTVYLVLDSDSLAAPQTFELDLDVTGP